MTELRITIEKVLDVHWTDTSTARGVHVDGPLAEWLTTGGMHQFPHEEAWEVPLLSLLMEAAQTDGMDGVVEAGAKAARAAGHDDIADELEA